MSEENENSKLASGVGQGSTKTDVTQVYDDEHGRYKGNEPAGEPSIPHVRQIAPFKFGG